MQSSQLMITILLLAAFGGFAVFTMAKRKKAMANLGPAFRRFFETTGFRFAEMPQAPLDDHVRLAEQKMREMSKGKFEQHLVKNFQGMPLHHEQTMCSEWRAGTTTTTMSCRWTMPLAQPPRVLWQIADKSLSGLGKAVKEAFSNTTRDWSPTYRTRIETGDPVLDKRFVIFGHDAGSVVRLLATPGLKELLLACTEVDLCVRESDVYFADPFQKNIRAGMGGTLGAMAIGTDYGKFVDSTIPVHERMGQLLALAARVSS